ncbi:MAG: cytochrome c3 family protein [Sandaracinaceae bacterium]|nr:cytochrome c3 family protein [Sandaracinaceae bacterium]
MQVFPKSLNLLPIVAVSGVVGGGAALVFVVAYYFSPWHTQVGYAPAQPIRFSHRLHAGQLGMDCRYCHANVERSGEAMIPPTQTCMGCHAVLHGDPSDPKKATKASVQPLFDSWATGQPIPWVRVHNLPDHAYFDHSIHLSAGIGCVSCHGRIDQMEVVRQDQPLSMAWCLDCHRYPEPHLRPVSEITNMSWVRPQGVTPEQFAQRLVESGQRYVFPPQNCGGCHR